MDEHPPLETLSPGRTRTMRELEAQRRRLEELAASVAAVLDHTAEMPATAVVEVGCLRDLIGWPLPEGAEDGG